jgi:MOSC domain-containing protein YiiM
MEPVEEASAVAELGLAGNANQGGARQITVVSEESFAETSIEMGQTIDPMVRRANLLVSGIELKETTGQVLQVGKLRILIKGETRPCGRMDEAVEGLQAALLPGWRGGAYGVALDDAEIKVGDPVRWGFSR